MQPQFQPADPERFAQALSRFDELNAQDPNKVSINGVPQPQELVYAQWLSAWVLRLEPNASEALRLAARSQHLCRWMSPRERYPMNRAGYLRWRHELKQFHAEKSAQVLRSVGYPEELVERVQALNLKKHFPADAEARVLEDALCLVFLEHQAADLASKTAPDKMVNALRKSWEKMTERARAIALAMPHPAEVRSLLEQALRPTA